MSEKCRVQAKVYFEWGLVESAQAITVSALAASSSSWVATRMPFPFRASSRNKAATARRIRGSRAEVGSSSRTNGALVSSARASPARCRSPPEHCPGLRAATDGPISSRASMCAARSRACAPSMPSLRRTWSMICERSRRPGLKAVALSWIMSEVPRGSHASRTRPARDFDLCRRSLGSQPRRALLPVPDAASSATTSRSRTTRSSGPRVVDVARGPAMAPLRSSLSGSATATVTEVHCPRRLPASRSCRRAAEPPGGGRVLTGCPEFCRGWGT